MLQEALSLLEKGIYLSDNLKYDEPWGYVAWLLCGVGNGRLYTVVDIGRWQQYIAHVDKQTLAVARIAYAADTGGCSLCGMHWEPSCWSRAWSLRPRQCSARTLNNTRATCGAYMA